MEDQKHEDECQMAEKTELEAQESELELKITEDESSCDTGSKKETTVLEDGCGRGTTGSEVSQNEITSTKLDDCKDGGVEPELTDESEDVDVEEISGLLALPVVVADEVISREKSSALNEQQNKLPCAVQLHTPPFVAKKLIFVKKFVEVPRYLLPLLSPKPQASDQQSLSSPSNLDESSNGVKRKREKSVSNGALESSDIVSTVPLNKLRRNLKMDGTCQDLDRFCWMCHKDGIDLCCDICPRVYHMPCVQLENSLLRNSYTLWADLSEEWVCPECTTIVNAENVETRSRAMRQLSLDQLCNLLKYALHRMKEYPGTEPFCKPVYQAMFPRYREFVAHPMDLSQLERNIRRRMYGSTEAFIADTKWILHNCIIFNTHHTELSSTAKAILKICKQEMSEIEICPDCYLNARTRKDSWFIEVCPKPHVLLWAKLKRFPFWPAKVMRTNREKKIVDVRFFGVHDRAWVPVRDCFLYSKCNPTIAHNMKKHNNLEACVNEVEQHIRKLRERFGRFEYASFRTPFDPSHEEEHLATFLPGYAGEKTVSQMPFQHRFRPRILRKPSDKPPTTDPQSRLGGFRVSAVRSEAPKKLGADVAAISADEEADDEGGGGRGGDGDDSCEPAEPVIIRPASAPPTSPPSTAPARPLRVYSRRRPSPSAPNALQPVSTEPSSAEEPPELANDVTIIKQEPEEIETSKIGSALLSDWARFKMESGRITMNQHQSNTSNADLQESAANEIMDMVEIKDEPPSPEQPDCRPTTPLSPTSHTSNSSPKSPTCKDSLASPPSPPVVTPAEECSDSFSTGKQSPSSSPTSLSLPPSSKVLFPSSDIKNDGTAIPEKADRPAPSGESDMESLNITEDDTSSLSSASETAEREIWARMTEDDEEEEDSKEEIVKLAAESEGTTRMIADPGKLTTENSSTNSNISRKRTRSHDSGDSEDSSAPSSVAKTQKLCAHETDAPSLAEEPGSGCKVEDTTDKKAGMLPDLIHRLHGVQPRKYKTPPSCLKMGTDETSESDEKYEGSLHQEGDESDTGLTTADFSSVNSPVGGDSSSNSNSSLSSSSSSNSGASSSSSSSNSSCSSSNSNSSSSSSSSSTSSNATSNNQNSDPKPPNLVSAKTESLENRKEDEADKLTAKEIKINVSIDNKKEVAKQVCSVVLTNAENTTDKKLEIVSNKLLLLDRKDSEEKGS